MSRTARVQISSLAVLWLVGIMTIAGGGSLKAASLIDLGNMGVTLYHTNSESNIDVNTDLEAGNTVNGSLDVGAGALVDIETEEEESATSTENSTQAGGNASLDARGSFILGTDDVIRINRRGVNASDEALGEANMRANADIAPADVSTQAELIAYASTTISTDESLEEMSFNGEAVEIQYEVPGRFLGLLPITTTVTVVVEADGSVDVHYPWYSFIVSEGREMGEEELEARIASEASAVITSRAAVESSSEADTMLTASEAARIASSVHMILRASADASTEVEVQ